MATLRKHFTTGTDFTICVYGSDKEAVYFVTTHDDVMRRHFDIAKCKSYHDAERVAKGRAEQYRL